MGDVVRLLVGVAREEVGLRAVRRLVGHRLRVLLVEIRGARVLLIVVEHRRGQAQRLLAVLGLRELRVLRDGQVSLDRLVELEEAVVVAGRVPQRLLAPLGIGIAAVEALVALRRLAELEQLLVDDAGVVQRGGRARILRVRVDDVDQVQRQPDIQLRRTAPSSSPSHRAAGLGGRRQAGDQRDAARSRLAHRQLLVGPLLLILHGELETLGDDHRLHRRLDLRDARQVGLRRGRLATGRLAELFGDGQQLAERAVLLLLVLDQVVDEVGLQDRVVGLEADVGLGAAVLLGDLRTAAGARSASHGSAA